jgi:hypothetical protein
MTHFLYTAIDSVCYRCRPKFKLFASVDAKVSFNPLRSMGHEITPLEAP